MVKGTFGIRTSSLLVIIAFALGLVSSGADLTSSMQRRSPAVPEKGAEASTPGKRTALANDPGSQGLPVPANRELYLSDLDLLLSSAKGPLGVHLCFVGQANLGELEVAQGAVVAEALALRAQGVPLQMTFGPRLAAVPCNVLIGTVDQVKDFLPVDDVKKVQRCILSLRRLPGRADSLLLVVAGKTPEAVTDAILSLAFVRTPFPNAPSALIREIALADQPEFLRQPPLESSASFTLGDLVERGAPARPLTGGGLALELFFPGFHSVPTTSAKLALHVDTGTGTAGAKTTATVKVNGRTVATTKRGDFRSSPLKGSEVNVSIPLEAFRHGANLVEIVPEPRNDRFQVFSDSILTLPKFDQPARLPDLRNTAGSFFPFVGQPDGSDLAVRLADATPETIQSAWTLLARLAHGAQTVLYAADVGFGAMPEGSNRHQLFVGPYSGLPPEVQVRIPFAVFDSLAALQQSAAEKEERSGRNLKEVIEQVIHRDRLSPKPLTEAASSDDSISDSGKVDPNEFGYLACLAPGKGEQHWKMVLTAFSHEQLLSRTNRLVQPAWWGRIEGDVVRWAEEPAVFQSNVPILRHLKTAERPYVEFPFGERFDVRIWMMAVAGIVVIFTIVTVRVLERRLERSGIRETAG